MKTFKEITQSETVKEDYKSDTKKYIDKVLNNVDDKDAEKFLNGLKKFVDDNGFLTPAQRQGLAQFRKDK